MCYNAGAVAMAGIEPGLWSVKGGNKELCYKLVASSSANLIQEHVTKVGMSGEKFTILTSQRFVAHVSYHKLGQLHHSIYIII